MLAIIPGFLAGLSLIIAIGAQNAFVIRQGLTKKYVLLTVLICACSDALLIALGASGLGALIKSNKDLLEFVRWFGVAYLLWFAYKSARSAFKSAALNSAGEASADKKSVILTVLGLTFLNPHVYLDTMVLLGAISVQYNNLSEKIIFAIFAMIASFVFFFSLGYGAKFLAPYFKSIKVWVFLDIAIAFIMYAIAYGLYKSL